MVKKVLSRKKELEMLREKVRKLKAKVRKRNPTRKVTFIDESLSKDKLRNMSVKQLRRLIVDNKLFQGISRMRKISLIAEIMKTPYYKSRSLPKPSGTRPTIKNEFKNVLKEKRQLEAQLKEPKEKEEKEEKEEKKEDEQSELNIDASGKNKKGLLSHHDEKKKTLDVGNTIINMYCGGSSHPDFPVPQSLVRTALNAQQLPLERQKVVGHDLRQRAKESPQFQGIPTQHVPSPVKHESHKNILSKWKAKAKKFPAVKTVTPLKQIAFPDETPDAKTETKTASRPKRKSMRAVEEDVVVEETPVEEARRLRQEDLQELMEIGRSDTKAKEKRESIKARLESKLKKPTGKVQRFFRKKKKKTGDKPEQKEEQKAPEAPEAPPVPEAPPAPPLAIIEP